MKRTKQINFAHHRKSWRNYRMTPIAIAISATFMLAGCEKADETVTLYQNAEQCSAANPSMSNECQASFQQAQLEAIRTAPKYATQEDCIAEFGAEQCVTVASAQQASNASPEALAQQPQQSGSTWMPLLMGYMMGRMMGGAFSQQPVFTPKGTSPAAGKVVDASGKTYNNASYGRSMTVDKGAMAPKPTATNTITRGGFGEKVAKQSASRQQSSTSNRYGSSSRSVGG